MPEKFSYDEKPEDKKQTVGSENNPNVLPAEKEEENKISRRQVLKKIGKGLAVLALGGAAVEGTIKLVKDKPVEDQEESLRLSKEVERIFSEFPERVAGIKKIEKIEVSGAKHVFVFMRQQHTAEGFSALLNGEESLRETNDIQRDIYCGLVDLKSKIGIESVYSEGFIEEGLLEIKKKIKDHFEDFVLNQVKPHSVELEIAMARVEKLEPEAERFMKMSDKEIDQMPVPEKRKAIDNWERYYSSKKVANGFFKRYQYAASGIVKLYSEGILDIKPAENYELNQKAVKANEMIQSLGMSGINMANGEEDKKKREEALEVLKKKEKSLIESIFKDREDYLLKEVSHEGALSVGVFGVGHDFADNLNKWNKDNSSNKISLIILTPEHLSVD